jgi:hypothetical protein
MKPERNEGYALFVVMVILFLSGVLISTIIHKGSLLELNSVRAHKNHAHEWAALNGLEEAVARLYQGSAQAFSHSNATVTVDLLVTAVGSKKYEVESTTDNGGRLYVVNQDVTILFDQSKVDVPPFFAGDPMGGISNIVFRMDNEAEISLSGEAKVHGSIQVKNKLTVTGAEMEVSGGVYNESGGEVSVPSVTTGASLSTDTTFLTDVVTHLNSVLSRATASSTLMRPTTGATFIIPAGSTAVADFSGVDSNFFNNNVIKVQGGGELVVKGDFTISKFSVEDSSTLIVTGTLKAENDVKLFGKLYVGADLDLKNNTSLEGEVYVKETFKLKNNLDANKLFIYANQIESQNNIKATESAIITKQISLKNNLTLTTSTDALPDIFSTGGTNSLVTATIKEMKRSNFKVSLNGR